MQASEGSAGARAHVGVAPLCLTGLADTDKFLGVAVAEEVSSALSRFRVVVVVSPSTVARCAGGGHDETSLRPSCGLDFLVSGGIQRAGRRLRIWLRLVDLRMNHRVVWAQRFYSEDGDVLSLLDEISMAAAGQVIPQILLIESDRLKAGPIEGETAYELVFRALPLMKRMDRDSFDRAGAHLAAAIAREPDYSPAHTWHALWHSFQALQGWADDCNLALLKAGELAARAVTLDPGDAFALSVKAHATAFLRRRAGAAAAMHEQALELNPNLGMGLILSAISHACVGNLEEAEKRCKRLQNSCPFDPSCTFFGGFLMLIPMLKRDYESVIAAGRAATQLGPPLRAVYRPYLSALGHLGRTQESAVVRARLLEIDPDFSIETYMATSLLERESDRQHLAAGLRLAGVA